MERMYSEDFNMVVSNSNGQFVRISELNTMIEFGAIKIDRELLEKYKNETRIITK